jgi:hypothetical protein
MSRFTDDIALRGASAVELRARLDELLAERALAGIAGLHTVSAYMDDLDHEIEGVRDFYVGTAVTEIATLRAALFGPQTG